MNVRFLREISEAYILDTELDILPDKIFDELYDTVRYIRECDIELYNELYEADSLRQQQILKNYLDLIIEEQNPKVLNESIEILLSGKVLIGILGFVMAAIYRKSLTKGMFQIIATIGKALESVGNWIVRRGQYMKLRYAIIQQNAKKCYIRCGITDLNKISSLAYFTITTKSSLGTKTSLQQSSCLRECYIENLIEVIALHMESYFACLKKTGAYNVVQKADSDELMKMIASTNIAAVCSDHYNIAKTALENFYKVLDLVYNEQFDEDKKLDWIQKLRARLYDARNQVQKLDDKSLQRYGQDSSNRNYQQQNQNKNYQQQNQNKNYQQQNQNKNYQKN